MKPPSRLVYAVVFLVATFVTASAFALMIQAPGQPGFFHRWFFFARDYGWAAGIATTVAFGLLNHRLIKAAPAEKPRSSSDQSSG